MHSVAKEWRDTPVSLWLTYLIIYLIAGLFMNQVGIWANIAKFAHSWQIVTCYGLYMVPISILLRKMSVWQQYLHGLLAMCLLEFFGYALGTSIALGIAKTGGVITVNGNILAEIVDVKNFSLAMAIFFALYFPLGNALVEWVHQRVKVLANAPHRLR